MKKSNVTKAFLPPIEEYEKYLEKIWGSNHLTNEGPLLHEFERELREFLEVKNIHFVSNGTIALQIALKTMGITSGDVITTPFSYVATTSSILWEGLRPVFVDIDPVTLCIDPEKIESSITKDTKAILAVHVFGMPCNVKRIQEIAKKHKLKVIYDGAHCFGIIYQGKSLLSYGDASTCSFHATKIFHTIEGGCIITPDSSLSKEVEVAKRFGHTGDVHYRLGINGKASEFQAAMGLCNLQHIDKIIRIRKELSEYYDKLIGDCFQIPQKVKELVYNYAYYPVICKSEDSTHTLIKSLNKEGFYPRRYFYPSLNTLPYLNDYQSCPISEDISKRIICLPLYVDLEKETVRKICNIMKKSLND